jgi:hypothetical protein
MQGEWNPTTDGADIAPIGHQRPQASACRSAGQGFPGAMMIDRGAAESTKWAAFGPAYPPIRLDGAGTFFELRGNRPKPGTTRQCATVRHDGRNQQGQKQSLDR